MSDPLTPEQFNLRAAERAHDVWLGFIERMTEQVMKDAQSFLRTLVLINGGAVIALLTFVGGLLAKPERNAVISGIAHGLFWFAGGLIFAALASGMAYATNFYYGREALLREQIWVPPYYQRTPKSDRSFRIAIVYHLAAVVLAVASLALFAIGVWTISAVLSSIGT